MATKKISELTAKGATLGATDLLEISEGGTVTKSVTGANIPNFANTPLTFTANRTHDLAGYVATLDNAEIKIIADANTSGDVPLHVTKTNGTTDILKALGDGQVYALGKGSIATNTAFGKDVFDATITGVENTAMGGNAMRVNTTGFENVSVGHNSMYLNAGGYYNTALGVLSLKSNTAGVGSTALGHGALEDSTGNYNVGVGKESGEGHTSGGQNTYLGAYTSTTNGAIEDAIVIGYNAEATASGQLVIGSGSNPVGSVDAVGTFTQTNRMIIKLNGVDYYIALDAV